MTFSKSTGYQRTMRRGFSKIRETYIFVLLLKKYQNHRTNDFHIVRWFIPCNFVRRLRYFSRNCERTVYIFPNNRRKILFTAKRNSPNILGSTTRIKCRYARRILQVAQAVLNDAVCGMQTLYWRRSKNGITLN